MAGNKRGKASKIDLLPEPIKQQLDALLLEKKITQKDIVTAVNKLIESAGLKADQKVSTSAVNRYSTRMHTATKKVIEARYVADQLVNKIGDAPSNNVSKSLIELVRGIAFDNVLNLSGEEEPIHPKLLKELSMAINYLEKADSESDKRAKAIRKEFADAAAKTIDKSAKQAGLTSEGATLIKQQILGLA